MKNVNESPASVAASYALLFFCFGFVLFVGSQIEMRFAADASSSPLVTWRFFFFFYIYFVCQSPQECGGGVDRLVFHSAICFTNLTRD